MPKRGRIPPFLALFVLAFAFVGLVGFQIVRERRIASANIGEKESLLENASTELKEQVKLANERQKERDTAQARLLEFEQKSKSAEDSLHQKDSELQNMKSEYEKTVEELLQLKKDMKQKEEEIVHTQEKLREHSSFEQAKESPIQINNSVVESSLENRQAEEHKPADEAGLNDRKGLHEEEDTSTDGHLSATEKEMDERSKPKQNVQTAGETKALVEAKDKEVGDSTEELSKPGDLQEEKAGAQDTADTRDIDDKEMDDLHEVTQLESDLQNGSHEDTDAQDADHGLE